MVSVRQDEKQSIGGTCFHSSPWVAKVRLIEHFNSEMKDDMSVMLTPKTDGILAMDRREQQSKRHYFFNLCAVQECRMQSVYIVN